MISRYFGMDIHQRFVIVAAVDDDQEIILAPQRVEMAGFAQWVKTNLTEHDQVVIEVSSNAWFVYDLLCERTGHVVVANPYKTKLIAEARIKNDKVDALALAQLLAAHFICDVWAPPPDIRQNRGLASHRAALRKHLTQVKNRIHALLHRHMLKCPEKTVFSRKGREWLANLSLPALDRLQLDHLLQQLDLLMAHTDETDRQIARQCVDDPRALYLMQLTGVNTYTAFAVLAFIGQIDRFASSGKLTSYAGLVPSLHQSGNKAYHGPITKSGQPILRWLMTEAARCAIRFDPHWQRVYQRIAKRRGSNIAVVAVARKMLVVIWHLLKNRSIYHHLRPEALVRKLQNWAYRIGHHHLPSASSQEFVQQQLRQLGLNELAEQLTMNRKGRLCIVSA
jgi:transposase